MRHTEQDIAFAAAQFLAGLEGKSAPIPLVKEAIPRFLQLSTEDLMASPTRPGEKLWEQQVRNIVSHRKSVGNWIYEGYLEYSPGFLSVTAEGVQLVSSQSVKA